MPQLLIGAGLSFVFPPLATLTVDTIPSEEMGYATSIIALMRNVGASIGISIVTTELARRRQAQQNYLAGHLTQGSRVLQNLLDKLQANFSLHGAGPVHSLHQALAMIYQNVLQQAALLSYVDGFRLLAILFLFVAPLAWLMRKPHPD